MSHTPGPWRIHTAALDGGRTVMDAHGRAITFAPVFIGSSAPDLGTAAANARLIAAAPDLLAALRECITSPGAHCAVFPRDADLLFRRLVAINDLAHAAIAKAA